MPPQPLRTLQRYSTSSRHPARGGQNALSCRIEANHSLDDWYTPHFREPGGPVKTILFGSWDVLRKSVVFDRNDQSDVSGSIPGRGRPRCTRDVWPRVGGVRRLGAVSDGAICISEGRKGIDSPL